MLDLFLESMYVNHERAKTAAALQTALSTLPNEELISIANGTSPLCKVASDCSDSGEAAWLDQFQGSPLYDKALGLERQCLELDMQRVQGRQEREAGMDASNQQQDVIRVQKRMLELELAQSKHQGAGGEAEPLTEVPPGVPPGVAEAGAPAAGGEGMPMKQAATEPVVPALKDPALIAAVRDKVKAASIDSTKVASMRFQLAMQKLALPIPGGVGNLLQAAKNVGQLGLHMAQKNPTAALGLAGAGVGALAAGKGNRLAGAAGGGALGAGIGGMPQVSGGLMRGASKAQSMLQG